MRFRVKVQNMKGNSWWEEFERDPGQANTVRGHGQQPEFNGDIQAWGIAIVDWFNKDASHDGKRRWLASEMLPDAPAAPAKPVKRKSKA